MSSRIGNAIDSTGRLAQATSSLQDRLAREQAQRGQVEAAHDELTRALEEEQRAHSVAQSQLAATREALNKKQLEAER